MKTVVVFLFFLSVPFLFNHVSPRFKFPPSIPALKNHSEWEIPPMAPQEEEQIGKILSQPYFYLGSGHQSYVFESKDGEYVIKLFKYRCTRFLFLENIKAWAESFYKLRPKDPFFVKADKTFKAARLAYMKGKQYTQIVFCHLNLTKDKFPIVFFKKGSKVYPIALDRYRFVIQKKLHLFKPALLAAKDDPVRMQTMIDSFIQLLIDRVSEGIRNSDPNLSRNFGFFQTQAVEMDFGNYRKLEDLNFRKKEIEKFIHSFRHWLYKNASEYVDYLDGKYTEKNSTIGF